jgi:hypothetical protein
VKDLDLAIKRGTSSSMTDQDRTQSLLCSTLLLQWLRSPHSQFLLVDGNASQSEKLSPVSFACGILYRIIEASPENATRSVYFCGRHTTLAQGETGAEALMTSLVGQLCTQFRTFKYPCLAGKSLDLCFAPPKRLDTLCAVYQDMVHKLPETETLFCIIDGLKYYEKKAALPGMLRVLDMLKALTRSRSVKACVKILIVNPTRSTPIVKAHCGKDDVLRLPSSPLRSGHGLNHKRYQQDMVSTLTPTKVTQTRQVRGQARHDSDSDSSSSSDDCDNHDDDDRHDYDDSDDRSATDRSDLSGDSD